MLAGDGASFIGCEEQHHARNVAGIQIALEALLVDQRGMVLVREPELTSARG